jgi:hypothetical protein
MQKLSRLISQHCTAVIANPKIASTTRLTVVVDTTFGLRKRTMEAEICLLNLAVASPSQTYSISGLGAVNFIVLVCVHSSSESSSARITDIIKKNRVRVTSFYLTKLYPLSNFDRLYPRQYWSYEQTSKRELDCFFLSCL